MRRLSFLNLSLIATTVLSGAYVAGNDAGHAYNSFPKMGDEWIPSEILKLSPMWKNFTENTGLKLIFLFYELITIESIIIHITTDCL